jgi:hypothetical protein
MPRRVVVAGPVNVDLVAAASGIGGFLYLPHFVTTASD